MTLDERAAGQTMDERGARLMLEVLAAGGPPGPTSVLSDGTTGWHMRRVDDCWAAAVATCLQAAYDEVPDARIDEQLARGVPAETIDRHAERAMRRWLDRRGLTLVEHDTLPTRLERWIGVVTIPLAFKSHTLVMARDQILFDPAVRPGIRTFYPIEVDSGFSFSERTRNGK